VSDLVVFVAIAAAMAGVGIALGMIVAGRMDRLMAPRSAEPPPKPPESPTAPTVPKEEQS
jgi:hypothetical protein